MKLFRRRFRPQALTLRRKLFYAMAVALPLIAIFTFGNRGLLKRYQLETEVTDMRQGLYRERAITDSLRAEIIRVRSDTAVIERLARERYGMARAGETIYKVEE